MISGRRAIRVTAVLHRELAPEVTSAMEESGLGRYHTAAGRWILLRERRAFLGLSVDPKVVDHPVDILSLLVSPELELGALELITRSGGLSDQGRGSVFSEEVVIHRGHDLCGEIASGPGGSGKGRLQRELTGICCIVQRGQGDAVARVALDTGTCVPAVTFGYGTGIRDKLGLLRITVPAEKEVIRLAASSYDAEALMNLMIQAGKLDQPGKGFIYLHPIRWGQINMKVMQGMARHAASMEQIIVAIDEIKGESSWRARGGSPGIHALSRKNYLHDLASLTYTCNEGRAETLLKAAMDAGAPGATMTRMRHVAPQDSDYKRVSPAREVCDIVLARSQVDEVVGAMERQGALGEAAHGQFILGTVPKAYTYTGSG